MTGTRPVALVTGGGTGIGRAVALGLAGAGYAVAVCGRRREQLEETAAAGGGDAISPVVLDVTDPLAVRDAFAGIEQRFGRLDLLFNNAGAAAPAVEIDELTIDQWHGVVRVNLDGAFYCAREAFGLMRRQAPRGGRIINNGSVSAQAPRPRSVPYTATKHAITGLTKSLSLDGRPYDIACGQIDIGNAATDIAAGIARGVPQADGAIRAEPMMGLAEVVEAVLLMARLPLTANVQFMTVMATTMPLVGRG